MQDALHVVVPVAIVHVGYQSACSQRQIGRVLLDGAVVRQLLDEDNLLAVGRELEALDTRLVLGELFAVGAVWVHAPELSATDEGNLLSAIDPCRVTLVLGIGGECLLVFAIGIHHEEHLMALVFFYAVVAYLVNNLLAVRRSLCCTNSSHRPEGLWGHQVVF